MNWLYIGLCCFPIDSIAWFVLDQVKLTLQVLRQLIDSQDEVVLSDACWAISFMFDGCDDSREIQALVDAGVCPRLVELLT